MSSSDRHYPRDFIGYGRTPPNPNWPDNARIAIQFVLNYEEGAERCVLHGDTHSETFLSEISAAEAFPMRHMSVESVYEYGSRVGVWRLLDIFARNNIPITVFGTAMALMQNPDVTQAFKESGHEIAAHGWRWISYQLIDKETERADMDRAVRTITDLTGNQPLGWYTGRDSPNTRRLVVEHGGFLYDSDSYADDLPYWTTVSGKGHLVIPYALDTNDMRFAATSGFNNGDQFFTYLRDSFDVLYKEGETFPKMLSIGLHCRLAGRPGRLAGLARFIEYIGAHDSVWICRRLDIARHWITNFPYHSND